MRHSLVVLAVGLVPCFATPASAAAAPGDLDTGFGTGGIVTSDINDAEAIDVAIQPDGKLVTVGSERDCIEVGEEFSCHSEFLIERYNSNGTLDTSFGGGDGIVTTSFGNETQGATSVLIEPSGKLLVGGTTSHQSGFQTTSAFAVARYNADGSLDTSFGGGDGKVTTEISGAEGPQGWSGSMVLLPSGKIVLGGEVFIHEEEFFTTWHLALTRFNADGSLDTSFGTGGHVIGPVSDLYGLIEEPGGKLLAAGRAGNNEFAVVRFNSDGSFDSSFSGDGIATLDSSAVGSQADDLLVQPDGKIVVAGYGIGMTVARFNENGTLDSTFGGGDGMTTPSFSSPCCVTSSAISVTLQADGRIVIAGQWRPDYESFKDEWAVARFYPNGAPDKSFGTGGLVTNAFKGGGYEGYATGVALQADGKIVAVGTSGYPDYDLGMMRFLGGGTAPQPSYHRLVVQNSDPTNGHVIAPDLGCGYNCAVDYEIGETVELDAVPAFGSSFTGWATTSGNPGTCTGTTTPCEVTFNGDVELVANFDGGSPAQYNLTTNKGGSGSGTVTSSPIGINCGATCSYAFNEGTSITLTATPAAGSTFTGWSGGCFGTGACELTLASDVEVTATFTVNSPASAPHPKPVKHKKPLKCRKGFKKRKVHGKAKCVKVKKSKRGGGR